MAELVAEGCLTATEEVLVELGKKDDDVYDWAKARREMFIPIDQPTQVALAAILERFERLVNTQRNRSTADPWVIALAQVEGCTVVTGESPSGSPSRPKIPDVCRALDIRCISLLQMIRENGWVFRG